MITPGATLLGVILSSDKTTISTMTGNQMAYLLLISLANIKMNFCMKGLQRAFLLLALLPVAKFLHSNQRVHDLLHDCLTHVCLDFILKPAKQATTYGIMMSDPLGELHHCFTLLVAYIVNTPEATMLAGILNKTSPVTLAMSKQLGDNFQHTLQTGQHTLDKIATLNSAIDPSDDLTMYVCAATAVQLNGVHELF